MLPQIIGMFKENFNRSLRFRFLSVISCVLVIGTLVTSLVIAINERRMRTDSLEAMGKNLASYIAKLSKEPLIMQDRIQLDTIVDDANKNEYVAYIMISDKQGVPLTSLYSSVNYYLPMVKSTLMDLSKDNDISDIIKDINSKGSVMELSSFITSGPDLLLSKPIGTVTVGMFEGKTYKQMVNTILFIIIVNLSISFILIVVVFIASKRIIFDPIVELANASSRIYRGDRSIELEIRTTGEVKTLVESFNEMVRNLDKVTVSKDYVDNIIRSMTNTLIVISTDNTIISANAAACILLGYEEEELIGRSAEMIFSGEKSSRGSWVEAMLAVGRIVNVEEVYRTKDGRAVPVLLSASIMRDQNHLVRGIVQVAEDVSKRKRAEVALRQSEERFRSLLQGVPSVAVQGYGPDCTIQYWNQASERLYGYSAQEAIGRNFLDLIIPPEMRKEVKHAVQQMAKTGQPIPASELSLMRRDGSQVNVFSSHAFVQIPGHAPELFCIDIDVTERNRAEEALKESEATLKSIFRVAPVGIGLVTGTERILKQVNDRLCKIIGYSMEELVGESARILYPSGQEFEWVGRVRYAQIIQRGIGTVETQWQKKDGSLINVLLSSAAIDPIDLTSGVIFTALDISERKRADAALRESQARFRELAELLPETIFEMDTTGNLTFVNWNAFDLFGYSQEDFERGLNGFELVSPEDRPRALENAQRVMRGEKIGLNEYKALKKDGSIFPVVMHSVAKFHDGKPLGFRGIIIDITETKKLEAQLRQAQKMEAIGTLAAGITHDFNNILMAIIGYTEIIKLKLDQPALHGYLDQVLRACDRAKNLVRQILTFSRVNEPEKRPVDIGSIIKETIRLLRATIPAMIEIHQNIASDVHAVLADSTQIHQVLMNLCTNAAHAMREKGGVLDVALDNVEITPQMEPFQVDLSPGSYVKLTVSDTGVGIVPEVLHRIFDPFFTTKSKGEGTGLGLSVVFGIVKEFGGTIMVHSEPGAGSVFSVYLPTITDITESRTELEDPILRGTERILFVDDEESLMTMGRDILEELGYCVTVTTGSSEALELFRSRPDQFDVLITDMAMPGMTGADLSIEVLKLRPDVPIILCTGLSELITEEEARAMGIRSFAMKPFSLGSIANLIRKVLQRDS